MIIKYSIKYQDVKMAMTEHLLPPQEEVPNQGNGADVTQVQIGIPGWQPSLLWTWAMSQRY